MSDDAPSKLLALASAAALVLAAVSGGAVTYASFTDAGNVAVTFSVGNVPEDPNPDFAGDETPTVGTSTTGAETEGDAGEDSETDSKREEVPDDDDPHNGSAGNETTNDTSVNDGSENDTSVNDGSAIDRLAAEIRSESTSRTGGREEASFRLETERDGVSGGNER